MDHIQSDEVAAAIAYCRLLGIGVDELEADIAWVKTDPQVSRVWVESMREVNRRFESWVTAADIAAVFSEVDLIDTLLKQ